MTRKLQRQEIWDMICRKYPSLKVVGINSTFSGGTHIKRDALMNILFEMNIHKSKIPTYEEQERIKYEILGNI